MSVPHKVRAAIGPPHDQDSLGYKITIFYEPGLSASGIGYSESEALFAANKQIPTGAKRGRTPICSSARR